MDLSTLKILASGNGVGVVKEESAGWAEVGKENGLGSVGTVVEDLFNGWTLSPSITYSFGFALNVTTFFFPSSDSDFRFGFGASHDTQFSLVFSL